ncbi:type II secretion system protein [Candidatus Peregrinibacteria bacterium]|nr:type II secretion system protein [Candidatus Peregrinibacteria bacterium]
MKIQNLKKGTTLLEILIYFAIVGIVLLAGLSFSIQIINTGEVSKNLSELNNNLQFITEKIVNKIQIAQSVDSDLSIFNNDQGALSLNVEAPADSPTVFSITSGDLFIAEGSNPAVKLNSNLIGIDVLRFTRLTYPKSPDQIVIDITLSNNDSDISQFNKSISAHLSISLRIP